MAGKLLISICVLITLCICAEIPIKKCQRKDSNFNKCLVGAIEHVLSKSTSPIKEIGIPTLEPLAVPSLTIGAGSGAVAFDQNYKKLKLTGISTVKCSKADVNFSTKTLFLECKSPLVRLNFDYEIHGKILLLPIFGKGPGSMDLENVGLQLTFNLEEQEKKGKKHYKVASQKFVLNPQLVKFKLENLFDGDKALGDNINQVLNDNWSEVLADVKPSYEEAFGKIFSSIFNNVLGKMSTTEIFGDA
ncbi:hypothetical protein Zmor_017271 [Zophobas morio]|uniref:Uncharacterized protein n=1 Tax=Zophobas morio TaxID=2755281 RepID=A0AA38I8Q7_9CUCU|nr:hypothetical protein Zmor_017271 [Zophobas morio]